MTRKLSSPLGYLIVIVLVFCLSGPAQAQPITFDIGLNALRHFDQFGTATDCPNPACVSGTGFFSVNEDLIPAMGEVIFSGSGAMDVLSFGITMGDGTAYGINDPVSSTHPAVGFVDGVFDRLVYEYFFQTSGVSGLPPERNALDIGVFLSDPGSDGYNYFDESFPAQGTPFTTGTVSVTLRDAAPIPEPTTLLLFGTGLVGVGIGKRRRRRRK